ncbi:hypothetical protein JHK87_027382 [Glycine soja]|nr:hypothetical protein JHK87_027382 [Glycine soja]
MILFSFVEGSISRSERKKSACFKVLYFTIWNVFFVNVFIGSVISQLSVFSSVTDLSAQLAKAVPVLLSLQLTFYHLVRQVWQLKLCKFSLYYAIFSRDSYSGLRKMHWMATYLFRTIQKFQESYCLDSLGSLVLFWHP